MKKEFYIDSYNNFVFKTTFKQYEEIIDAYSHDISAAVSVSGDRVVCVSINKTKFKEAIIAMTQTRDSVYQMELYADFSFFNFGEDHHFWLFRADDGLIECKVVFVIDGHIHTINMSNYLPISVIDFLTEY